MNNPSNETNKKRSPNLVKIIQVVYSGLVMSFILLLCMALSTIHDVMLKRKWIDDRTDNLSSKRTKLTLLQDLWYNKMIKF